MTDWEEGRWKVQINGFEGPVRWEGFDPHGNYGKIYENGAESWISREWLDVEVARQHWSSKGTYKIEIGETSKT